MTDHRIPRIAVIGGGRSDEHDVSLASASAVARALEAGGLHVVALTVDRRGGWRRPDGGRLTPAEAVADLARCDAAFPLLHGVDGEDGAIAGLLVMTGVPVVGSPVRAGALAMDKWATKLVAEALGIRTARGVVVRAGTDVSPDSAPGLLTGLALPVVVKPTTGGSSNGVTRVDRPTELAAAVAHARTAGDSVLIESFVVGREVDVAVFRDRSGALRTGAALEIGVVASGVFDRETKYDGTARFTVPAHLEPDDRAALEEAARTLYDVLGCGGVARFDFFVTADGLVLNEVNTCPGFTELSQVPRMFAATGLDYDDLVEQLVRVVVGVD